MACTVPSQRATATSASPMKKRRTTPSVTWPDRATYWYSIGCAPRLSGGLGSVVPVGSGRWISGQQVGQIGVLVAQDVGVGGEAGRDQLARDRHLAAALHAE